MKFLIVFDHPYGASSSENIPHHRSYSAALLAAVMRGLSTKGHTSDLIDLHADGFNPVTSAEELAAWRQQKTKDPLRSFLPRASYRCGSYSLHISDLVGIHARADQRLPR